VSGSDRESDEEHAVQLTVMVRKCGCTRSHSVKRHTAPSHRGRPTVSVLFFRMVDTTP
jgi:hypothetical protein